MDIIFVKGIILCSVVTSLLTESIKRLKANKSDNLLAAAVAIGVSLFIGTDYLLINNMPFDVTNISALIILIICTFMVATCGYDKVIQTIKQVKGL